MLVDPGGISGISGLGGRSVDQIGIVVDDLEQAVHRYASVWDVGPWHAYTYSLELMERMIYRGTAQRHVMRIAFAGEAPQIELIQPLEGPTIYHDFLEGGGSGLHHLGIVVEDIDLAVRSMQEAGYEIIQSGHGFGLDGDGAYAYFGTEADFGVVLELIVRPRRRKEPEAIW